MKKQVEEILSKIRPSLQADGGDVELVDVDEEQGIVKVKLQGACANCPMSQMTLKMGIEQEIKKQIKDVKEVIAV
ncbi:MAG: NifU family protein [Candidatus Buchananbacteria bacterium]|nr:NifU family protein [Candidatus Buchananbacteria bacterium]